MTPQPPTRTPADTKGLPGIGAFAGMAFAVVLVPALLVAALLQALGASLAVACMIGLVTVFVGMAAYPKVLRLLKWLPPSPSRARRRP